MDVTKNINLLKKYHKSLVYDYTEYPTKSNWPERFDEIDYSNSLINWLKNNPNSESLFYVHTPFCEELCISLSAKKLHMIMKSEKLSL